MLFSALARVALALVLAPALCADQLAFTASAFAPQGQQETALAVPAFDARLGTLERVEIELETAIDAHVGVENLGSVPVIAQAELRTRTTLRVPGQATPFTVTDNRNGMCGLQASDGTPDFAGPSGFVFEAQFALAAHVVVLTNLEKFETRGAPTWVGLRANARSGATITCSQPTISATEFGAAYRVRVTYVFSRR